MNRIAAIATAAFALALAGSIGCSTPQQNATPGRQVSQKPSTQPYRAKLVNPDGSGNKVLAYRDSAVMMRSMTAISEGADPATIAIPDVEGDLALMLLPGTRGFATDAGGPMVHFETDSGVSIWVGRGYSQRLGFIERSTPSVTSEPYSHDLFREVIGQPTQTRLHGLEIQWVSIPGCLLTRDDGGTPNVNEAHGEMVSGRGALPEAVAVFANTTDGPLTAFVTVAVRDGNVRVGTVLFHVQSLAPGEQSTASAYLQMAGRTNGRVFDSIEVVKVQAHPY